MNKRPYTKDIKSVEDLNALDLSVFKCIPDRNGWVWVKDLCSGVDSNGDELINESEVERIINLSKIQHSIYEVKFSGLGGDFFFRKRVH